MKKMTIYCLAFLAIGRLSTGLAQVTTVGNTGSSGDFVGWSSGSFPLQIRHNGSSQPIEFYTNSTLRATILGGTSGSTNGRMGIGNNLSGFTPQDRLHLYHDAASNLRIRLTHAGTTTGSTIGLNSSGEFIFTQHETLPMIFETDGATERMRITEDDRIIAFRNVSSTYLIPSYDAKFEINDRNSNELMLFRVRGNGAKLPGSPLALPGTPSSALDHNFTLAEIIQRSKSDADAGLKIQGSRTSCQICDVGFIDFTNYVSDPERLFNMSRVASGQHLDDSGDPDKYLGYLRFYTNNGEGDPTQDGDAGLLERMRINGFGVGYFNMIPSDFNSNLQTNTARFNILDEENAQLRLVQGVDGNDIADVYTGFQTTSAGNLFIEPIDENENDEQRFVGIHTSSPENTLEINATPAAPRWNQEATNGTSGLRFSHLDDSKTPLSNTGAGVLSVDSNGDVIYVSAGTGSGSGYGLCGDANGVLSDDSKIELNEYNFYFDVDAASTETTANKVGVGYECSEALPARLSVYQNVSGEVLGGTQAGSFINADEASGSPYDFIGVYASAIGDNENAVRNIGGQFTAENSPINIAVHSTLEDDDATINYGVKSEVDGGTTSYGGHFEVVDGGTTAYGGFFKAASASVNYGIWAEAVYNGNTPGTNRAGYFAGQTETTAGAMITSDQKFKQNVNKQENALELLAKLRPVTYDMKTREFPQFNFSPEKQHGFIAQEVEAVFPELVHQSHNPGKKDATGNTIHEAVDYKSVNYTGLISINTQAINELNQKVEEKDAIIETMKGEMSEQQLIVKEQQDKINDLNNRLSQLENCLSALLPALCQLNQSFIQQNGPDVQKQLTEQLQIILSDKNSIVLTQNVPNPFAESTLIQYSIPASVQQAQIHFYDAQGKLINSIDLSGRGNGELKVFAHDLSSGMYTYSLIADGKIVATKKMIRQ